MQNNWQHICYLGKKQVAKVMKGSAANITNENYVSCGIFAL
jgi:hypothetical protein